MDNAVQTPLLGHVHVPKTAGSSFRKVLDDYFGDSHLHLYFDHSTTFVYENYELAKLVRPPSVGAFSSHFVRRFPDRLGGRPVHYVTFLRDPVQQFVSYITYTRKHYAAIQDPVLLSHLPPRMAELTIRECARWILRDTAGHFRNFQENYTTNFFARYALADTCALDYAQPEYRRQRLAVAQRILSGFLMVGVSGYMDESWSILRRRATRVGIHLPHARIPRQNVTAADRDSLDWIHADDEVGRKLLLSVQEDTELYQAHLEELKRLASNLKVA